MTPNFSAPATVLNGDWFFVEDSQEVDLTGSYYTLLDGVVKTSTDPAAQGIYGVGKGHALIMISLSDGTMISIGLAIDKIRKEVMTHLPATSTYQFASRGGMATFNGQLIRRDVTTAS